MKTFGIEPDNFADEIPTDWFCPKCGSEPKDQEVRNYDPIWKDGDVFCLKCETRVRSYDAG